MLRRLVDRSLVVRDGAVGEDVGYRLLEPVRQYALEQLEARSGAAIDVRQQHATYFAALVDLLGPALRVPQDATEFTGVLVQIEQEYPNIRVAIVWALASDHEEIVAQIGWALCTFWWYRDQQREPRAWMEQALAQRERFSPQTRARGLLALAVTLYRAAASHSFDASHEAASLFEQSDDKAEQTYALLVVGLACLQSGNVSEAISAFAHARDLSQNVGNPWLANVTANHLGLVLAYTDSYTQVTPELAQVLATAKAQHDTWNELLALFNYALVAQAQGDTGRVAYFCRQL